MTTNDSTTADRAGAKVEYRGVRRVFGSMTALDGLDLVLQPGELVSLLGPSGCGKTTALRLLAGFDTPTEGQVFIDDVDVSGIPVRQRDIGMVFQAYSLFPTMSAVDNVAFGLRVRGEATAKRRTRASELLELVGLSAHVKKYPHQLSGGQQQRVALARALALQPRVLLLDEPLSALDAKVREQLRDEIRRIQNEVGVTTLMVTHDQEEALSMSDRVGVMSQGRLEQCAPPEDLYDRPATEFVAEFIGTMNRVSAESDAAGLVRVLGTSVPVLGDLSPAMGAPLIALIRPEAIMVEPAAQGWTVAQATFHGATTLLRLVRPGMADLRAEIAAHRARDLALGSTVGVTIENRPVLVIA